MAATNLNYHIDQNANYSTITLLPGLNDAQWSDIEQAGTDIAGRLSAMRTPAVIVDLTPLNYMGSSMVAMIVRCWKNVQTNKGRIVVVCNNDVVREVISLAGLTKVWPICETREDGLKELGVFSAAGGGERWLILAGILGILAGVAGAGMLLSQTGGREVALGLLFGGAGVGFVLGLVTLIKSTSSGRFWGLGIVLVGVAIAIIGFLNMNRIAPAVAAEPAEAEAVESEGDGETQPAATSDMETVPEVPTIEDR